MKNLPFVSIVICTQNRAEALKKYALNSILKLDYPNYEVVVVDDTSKDKTQEILKEFKNKIKNLTIVKNQKAKGLCYARNLGVKYAKGEIIAFTDDDCIVNKNWLKELVKPYKNKEVMVVGGKIYIGNSNNTFNPSKEIFGCNMSFRKNIFDNFSFDTNVYFNKCNSRDEAELIYRLKNKNLKVIYADRAIVKHFPQPAKYRKNIKIGSPLNKVYMYTKKIQLIRYYYLFFITLLFGKKKKITCSKEEEEIVNGFDTLVGLVSPRQKEFYKLPWISYILLIKIPFKAKIKDWLEKRKIN